MSVEFKTLKALAEQAFGIPLSEALMARVQQYQNVIPEEILDLLDEAAETYSSVESALPQSLRDLAKKEIEFFIRLYQDKIKNFPHIQNSQPPQKILQLLSQGAS
jgi:hypothetical protein